LSPSVIGGDLASPITVIPEWDTLDNDQRVTITLDVSLNELITLASAIDVGRDIAYGDDSIEIWQTWVRALNTMAICDQVAVCISESDAVKQALAGVLNDSGVGYSPNGVDTIVGSDNPNMSDENILTQSGCGEDDIAGECIAVVEAMNTLAVDYIERFIASTLPAEIALVAIEATPLIGHLTPGDAGVFLDWITDEILTQYTGAYDTALRNEAACLIYRECCFDCELTIDEMLTAWFEKVSIGFNPISNWANLIGNISSLSLANEIVYGLWLAILATWKAGDTWLGQNNTATLAYAASKATPIDPAVIGCDDCEEPAECLSWLNGATNNTTFGTATMTFGNLGIRNVVASGGAWRWKMILNNPPLAVFNRIIVNYDCSTAVIGKSVITSLIEYFYTDATSDVHNLDLTPPFGTPKGTEVTYVVPPPDPEKTFAIMRFHWETEEGNPGNSGTFYTRIMCFEDV